MLCATCHNEVSAAARFCGVCGSAVQSTERASPRVTGTFDQFVGRQVAGRYRLVAKLGEGGMGAVFRAEQISLKRIVAVKMLKPAMSADHALVRRFHAEAELAAKINHPNTVTLYDFGQDTDGNLFIAMEYIEGNSLRQVLHREGPLSSERALGIATQVAASLADAHTHGIIHRDLKPDNVMLTERGRQHDIVRVLDFGIAKLRDERGDISQLPLTQAGDLLGTPQYMAPEQIRGEPVDGRTDVYALGALLYEMVTGRLPFEAPTVLAILGKHLTDMPVRPAERRPDLPIHNAVDQLVMDALKKAPAERPSMDQLGERLGELSARLGTPSRPKMPALEHLAPPVMPAASGHGAAAGDRATTTGPIGRPPGVPTSPPGSLSPVDVGTASPFSQPGAAALATPIPHSYPQPASRSNKLGLFLGAITIAALAVGATIIVTRTTGNDAGAAATPAPARPAGEIYSGDHRWTFIVPSGFSSTPTGEGDLMMWTGGSDGINVRILIASARLASVSNLDLSDSKRIFDGIAEEFDGEFLDSGNRRIDGKEIPTATYRVPELSENCEFDLFVGTTYAAVFGFCAPEDRFTSLAATRAEYITQRFVAPP